jgi:hypothetical protein
LKKPGRTRDQRAAFSEIIRFLSRDGQARFRYLTLGFGKEQLELGRRVNVPSIDGGMPWLKTSPEIGAFPSIDELPLEDPAGRAALAALLARADELHLAYVISANPAASPIVSAAGYRSLAAFAGDVVLFAKDDVTPITIAPTPPSPPWALGLPLRGFALLWSAGSLVLLFFALYCGRHWVISKLST